MQKLSSTTDLDEATEAAEPQVTFLPAVISPKELADATTLPDSHRRAQRGHPLRNPVNGYTHFEYEREKRQGLRRTNGARKLKRLSSRHLDIISKHLAGWSGEQIASSLNCTFVTVSRVLNDPLAKEYLSSVYETRRKEIDALAGDAIDAVRLGLQSESNRERLAAVDKFTKLKDSIGTDEDDNLTAEDVIQRIFAGKGNLIETMNVQINHKGDD